MKETQTNDESIMNSKKPTTTGSQIDCKVSKPFGYLEKKPKKDAPISDNPSGLYCPACRSLGLSHCAHPEYCGGMRRMNKAC